MTDRAALACSYPLPGVDARSGVEVVRSAEAHGYQACWAAEVQGPDAFTALGALAVTTELDLGVAVVPAQTRTVPVLGMTAVSLAELSGGRFTLGLGASSEVIVSGWAGQPFERPLTAVRETVEALRPLLAGARSTYEGSLVRVGGSRPHATPPGGRVPLALAALNPRSARLVGELGVDAVCLNQLPPWHVARVLDEVRRGAGGPLPEDFGVVARLFCQVTDDVPAAREAVRRTFAPYLATRAYNRVYRWMGYEPEAQGVLDAAGDRAAMAAALSDRLIDEVFCLGTAEQVAAKVAAFVDAGVTVPVIAPLVPGRESAEHTLHALSAAWH